MIRLIGDTHMDVIISQSENEAEKKATKKSFYILNKLTYLTK